MENIFNITEFQRVEIKALERKLTDLGKLTVNGVAYDFEVEAMSGSWSFTTPKSIHGGISFYATVGWEDLNELPVQVQYTVGENSYMWVENYPLPPYALSDLWFIQALEKALIQFEEEAGRFAIKPTHYPELISV